MIDDACGCGTVGGLSITIIPYYSYADKNENILFQRPLFLLPTGVKAWVECTGIAEAFASLHRSCRANRGSACKGVVRASLA